MKINILKYQKGKQICLKVEEWPSPKYRVTAIFQNISKTFSFKSVLQSASPL